MNFDDDLYSGPPADLSELRDALRSRANLPPGG